MEQSEYSPVTRDAIDSHPLPFQSSHEYAQSAVSKTGFPSGVNPHQMAARGFAQVFGVHPVLAFFTIVVDAMTSAVDVATLGISVPVLWLIASIFTGVVIFMGQKKWYGDDQESAVIKSLMIAFLVALPTPFPAFLTVPSAIAGTVQLFRNRK